MTTNLHCYWHFCTGGQATKCCWSTFCVLFHSLKARFCKGASCVPNSSTCMIGQAWHGHVPVPNYDRSQLKPTICALCQRAWKTQTTHRTVCTAPYDHAMRCQWSGWPLSINRALTGARVCANCCRALVWSVFAQFLSRVWMYKRHSMHSTPRYN